MTKGDDGNPGVGYFDEDGNLTTTAWEQQEAREEAKREAVRRKRAKMEAKREAERYKAVEERSINADIKAEQLRKRRALRDEMLLMPKWIKSMPRVPMSAPPTEGKKEKALYALTKRVILTENESNRRKMNLRRLHAAMEDYRAIHQPFPPGTPMSPTTIISVGEGVGGSMLARSISKALAESRSDYGIYATVDFARPSSDLAKWYGKAATAQTYLRVLLAQQKNPKISDLTVSDLFPHGGSGEYYLHNYEDKHRRANPTIYDTTLLYSFMKKSNGMCLFDCDDSNLDALIACASFSTSLIFIVPISRDAPDLLNAMIGEIREGLGDEMMNTLLKNSIVVVSGDNPRTASQKGRTGMTALGKACADKVGIDKERVFIIPFDRALRSAPLQWGKVTFPVAHTIRSIAGTLVSDGINRYDPDSSSP